MPNRSERMAEALRKTAAEFLAREANPPPIGGLITVTRVEITQKGRHATILITVFPDTHEEQAVQFANRNRSEFAEFFNTRSRGMMLPRVEFAIDRGEKNRQRLDEIIS